MKNLLFLTLFILLCSFNKPETGIKKPLKVELTNIKFTNAPVYLAVNIKHPKFPVESNIVKYYKVDPKGSSSATLTISDLNYGSYAITIFQDLNQNQKIDKGFLGIPTEPFAFSNNYRPVFRAPKWSDCEFIYSNENSKIEITGLIKML
jgi:uncharacterized protein (DUF2141 family)